MKFATHPIISFKVKPNVRYNYYLGYLEPVTYTIEKIMFLFLSGEIRVDPQTFQDTRIFKLI